jgi:hypothetical protein
VNPASTFGVVFEFQCRADEYLEARRATLRVRPLEYWLNRAWGPTLLVLAVVAIARDPLDPSGYLVAAVGGALVLNGTVWLRRRARVEWRTIPRLGYRTWLRIGEAGLRLTTVDGDVYRPWSTVEHVVETPRTFALYRAPDDFQVIPKRAFPTESQLAGFRTRLATEWSRARSCTSHKKGRRVMSRMSVLLLLSGLVFGAAAACSQMPEPVSVDRCPPRTAGVASSSPRLSAGGKGVAPREEPSTSDGTTAPVSPHLASGGRGVQPRVETSEPGPAISTTPRLAAGGRGVAPRTECD